MARPHSTRTTRRQLTSAATMLHWLGMIAMVVGLFAPLAAVDASATVLTPERALMKAAQQPFDRDTADFERVVLTGDFQQQFGCGAWDTNCDQTRLQNANGIWTGSFNVPPGTWSWELVAIDRNGTQYSVDDDQVTVNDGQLGVFASFNSASRQSQVNAVTNLAVATGPFGTVALAQDGDGYVADAINVSADGWVDLQVQIGDQVVPTGANFTRGANRVTFDALGNITNVQSLGFAEITVQRMDPAGNPLPGSCFVLDGSSQSRGCDGDDGASDGATTLRFPGGVQTGGYTLRETTPADGQSALADQQVDVQQGQASIEARSEGEIEVESDPGDLVVLRQDQNGAPMGGSCFDLIAPNGSTIASACDEDGDVADDGRIGLLSVPAGDYTLRESRTPEGQTTAPDTQVSILSGQVTEQPVQTVASPSMEPVNTEPEPATEAPTEETRVGRVIVYRTDAFGAPVGGSCFEVVDSNGQVLGDACDEDGITADDGTTGITDIPVGNHTVRETRVPEGYEKAPDTPITVNEGDNEVVIAGAAIPPTAAPTEEPTEVPTEEPTEVPTEEPTEVPTEEVPVAVGATLTVNYTWVDGDPLACVELDTGGAIGMLDLPFACDNAENDLDPTTGIIRMENVPTGDFLVDAYQGPDWLVQTDPQPVSLPEGANETVTFQAPAPALTAITVQTTDGSNAVGGACYILDEGQQLCDDGSGTLVFGDVTPGDHTVRMISAPDGYNLADPDAQTQTIAADGSPNFTFILSRVTTTVTVQTTDGSNAVGGACYILDEGQQLCDDGSGTLVFGDVTPGDHTVRMVSAPDGYNQADPDAQTQTIAADGSPVFVFTISRVTVDLVVTTVDGTTGEPLTGACYTLDGSDPLCDDDATGDVVFSDLEPADRSLSMSSAPEGFEPAADQVVPAAITSLEVPLLVETGSIAVAVTDASSAALPGACVALDGGTPVCDAEDGAADGAIVLSDIPTGDHAVSIVSAPAGFDLPTEPGQTVTVVANESAPVAFQLNPTPPASGGLDVTVLYDDASAADGACVTAANPDRSVTQTACDGAAEDTNTAAGIVGFDGLPVGTYGIGLQDGYAPSRPIGPVIAVSGDVPADARGAATLTLNLLPETGSVEITVVADGVNLAGACFTIGDTAVCDNTDPDADGTAGVVLLTGLQPGDYAVTMTTVPGGYEQPGPQTATVVAGETAQLEFALTLQPVPGSITVRTLDGNGNPLTGACYSVMQPVGTVASGCDTEPADGDVIFENIPAGTYQLAQTQTPGSQFQPAPSRFVEVAAGENTLVEIVMDLRPGRLTVLTVDRDEPTLILQNACFTLVGGTTFGPFCDADDGTVDGRVRFNNLPAGQYELRQTVATAGYDPAANRQVTITANGSLQITVQNAKTPPPAESGTLVVIPLDPNGAPVAGGCYQVFNGTTPVSQRVCDNADDQPARITIANLPVGDFTLREMLAPSPDWQIAADIPITIANGETTTVEVPHQFKPGNVVVQAVSTVGLPLQGACFSLTDSGNVELCTDATGQATVTGLTPGTRQLTQTQAPFGFKLDPTPREVIVRPGQTTTVRVVFQNEPPPNTGTVQVQKFFCPAGDQGERTVFLGGAQGNQQLKQTAGCKPGVASFTLVAENGSTESNASFKTNTDGRAQLTAVQGIYVLTETDPDLPGNSAARIRVGVGQMTTVIVINYVKPPAPAPVTINVEGYTCAPGFTGSSFVDFQTSCMANSQLTNQITVRAESANRYKRLTGDTGVLGKTAFTDLPAGTYTIWAERPFSIPVSYLFCGPDANNPNQKAVNGSISTSLQSGTIITCRVFQVPPLFDANNGAIQVQKYNCPIEERQRGYDYKNECSRATEPIPFEIQLVEAKTRAPIGQPVRVSTNGDGIVQFPMLAPGTYKLTEVGGEWCFAQSNSVDANGDVIVTRNKLSEVWVYNCVGTTSPPNTGSGDAASILDPESGIGPMQVLPNLIWPTVLLAGWMIWRQRREA